MWTGGDTEAIGYVDFCCHVMSLLCRSVEIVGNMRAACMRRTANALPHKSSPTGRSSKVHSGALMGQAPCSSSPASSASAS